MLTHLEEELDFNQVLIRPRKSNIDSRALVSLDRKITFKHSSQEWTGVPVIAANMLSGTLEMARLLSGHGMLTALHKHHSLEVLVEFHSAETTVAANTFYTLGISDTELEKYTTFCRLMGRKPPMVCIDVANGYMTKFTDFVARFRDNNPDTVILAGNVVCGEATELLLNTGADIVKVGIGSGQNCLTRKIAGVGRPQLSAIVECVESADTNGGLVCSDGGCSEAADISIAICAGADFVMIGSMLSGTTECGGDIITVDGKQYKEFFGMSSNTAMQRFNGGRASYKASEGRTTLVPYRGTALAVVAEIKGGLSSTMSYIGAKVIADAPALARFVKVSGRLNSAMERFTIGN